jgi:excinuclease ABC subunit A
VETALKLGEGMVVIQDIEGEERLFSEHFACVTCGISLPRLSLGPFRLIVPTACPECTGLGTKMELDADLVIPNPHLSLGEGAVVPWAKSGHRARTICRYSRV